MNRIVAIVLLTVCIFITCSAFAADPLVVDLWPGKTPGDVGIEGQERSFQYHSEILGGPTKLITNVTKPFFQPLRFRVPEEFRLKNGGV